MIFNNKLGGIQKIIVVFTILILILPLGIYALENSTETNSTNLNNNSTSSSVEINETVEINSSMQMNTSLKNESTEELQPLTNKTLNETQNESEEMKVNIEIIYPTKIIRGENFEIQGVIENTGKVNIQNIAAKWILSEGFEILNGNEINEINEIGKDASVTLNLEIGLSQSTTLGKNEIKLILENGK